VKKKDEIANPNSCFNRARPDELVFVLLGRDPAAPAAIRAWAAARIASRKNIATDHQILESLRTADEIEAGQ
jgi:hypothetical protein